MEDTIYRNYVTQALKYPLMTFEQEIEHSKLIEKGDEAAKMRLVQANLRLVISIAKKYENAYISVMDLIQEGNIGLLTAATKYHYSYNTRFSTYAYPWITQAITRYIRSKSGMILLPGRKEDVIRKIKTTKNRFFAEKGRAASDGEVADIMNLSEDDVRSARLYSYSVVSIDATVDENGGQTLCDMLPDEHFTPEEKIIDEVNKNEIKAIVDKLSEMEREVIYRRFNFAFDSKPETLRQVGEQLGVSAETVRQMEIRALRKIRIAMAEEEKSIA